ncbi:hypothetical protein EDB83DRAFT_1980676 [Lactarius deliciosus]|nr:hypothetical protein EDB83DRAFT_1980676 [Lactarius deliciosus]
MASDISQVIVVDDHSSGSTLDASPLTSPDSTSVPLFPLGNANPPSNHHGFLPLPTPILRNSRISLDVPASHTPHTSDLSSLHPPPSPTLSAYSSGSIRWVTSTVLRDNNPEVHVGLPSLGLPTPPPQVHRRKGRRGIGSIFTDRDIEDPSNPGLIPVRFGQSDVPSMHLSSANTHVNAGPDTSHPSSVANFFKRTVQRICPSRGETDIGSDTAQEADLSVEPFAFKPLQLASLIDPKNLENLQRLGGVEGLLRGLGTDRVRGLSTRLTGCGSRDSRTNAATSDSVEMTSLKPNIALTSPTGPEGPQSTATFGGGSGVGRPSSPNSASAYETVIKDRQRIYGHNILPQRPRKSLLLLMWLAIQDKVLILLSIVAVVSLALGLSQDFGTTQASHPVDWVQGVAIIVAILVVVAVGSLNDWQRERRFQVLNEKKDERLVKVIRDGEERQIDVHQVAVGDVVLLEPGEVIPCDGVFLSGHNVRCDESSATGELDTTKKLSYEECVALKDKRLLEFDPDGPSGDGESASASQRKTNTFGLELLGHADCFIISGSKVVEGVGSYVVTSVGTKSFNGRITMALRRDSENTPLQLKLNDLSEIIAKISSVAGGLLFAALLIRYFVQLGTNNPQRTSSEKGMAFMNILIIALTLVVVAVPEGLPLAITHASAFATKRMSKDNLLVRVLGSCETMANASVICTDKTGTLTENKMSVVAGSVGVQAKLVQSLEENRVWTSSETRSDSNAKDFGIDLANLVNDSVRKFLQFHISTYFTTIIVMIVWALASSTDKPILGAVQLLWINIIMGTFATLALSTDPAFPVLLDRNPDKMTDPLFTVNMTKQILGHATYQIIITLALHFLGPRILGFHHTDDPTLQNHHAEIVQMLVFNA